MKALLGIWTESKNRCKQFFLDAHKLKEIFRRMQQVRLPKSLARRSIRSIEIFSKWKANEYKSWLLYYSVPVLIGILPEIYLQHYVKLVSAIHTYLKIKISYAEIDAANADLQNFVDNFQTLYGEVNMRFNVHLLTHLGRCVSRNGPLWAYSNFCFESGNGALLKFVNGTRGVLHQIHAKFLLSQASEKLLDNLNVSESVLNFCCNVKKNKFFRRCTDGVVILGSKRHRIYFPGGAAHFNSVEFGCKKIFTT